MMVQARENDRQRRNGKFLDTVLSNYGNINWLGNVRRWLLYALAVERVFQRVQVGLDSSRLSLTHVADTLSV